MCITDGRKGLILTKFWTSKHPESRVEDTLLKLRLDEGLMLK